MRIRRVRRVIVSVATMIALSLGAVGLGAATHQAAGQGDWPFRANPNSSTFTPDSPVTSPVKSKA